MTRTDRKTKKCPYCTQKVDTHPSGVMVPHTTGRNRGGECYGSRKNA